MNVPRGHHISTFHSLCVRILREFADCAGINRNFSIYDDAEQKRCLRQAVKSCEIDSSNFAPVKMLAAISRLKNNIEDITLLKNRADDYFSKILVRVFLRYQETLAGNNALDFDDLLVKTAFLLRDHPDIRRKLNNRFRFLLVDEYQDTNHAQYQIAKGLAIEHNNICVTGDPDQSIYGWRGADIGNILAFEKDWPNATVVKLEENFRSTPNILTIADSLIAKNTKRKHKTLIATKPAGKDVRIICFDDDLEEADAIAEQVRKMKTSGTALRDIAVLYRVNSMSRPIEEALIREKIQYQIVRGVEFYSRKEIRDMLAYLKILVNPNDEQAITRIINTPARGIGKVTINRLQSYAQANNLTFYEALQKAGQIESLSKAQAKLAAFVNMIETFKADIDGSIAALAERVFAESGLKTELEKDQDKEISPVENVFALINSAALYDRQAEEPSLTDYLQQIALFSDTDTYDPESGKTALMTLHAAKGLEFKNVFIVGLENGILPHERSYDDDGLEEERRLFFVGITRTREFLQISYANHRLVRGRFTRAIPSQFLYELGGSLETTMHESEKEHQPEYEYDYDDDQTYPVFAPDQLVRHKKFGLVLFFGFMHRCFEAAAEFVEEL